MKKVIIAESILQGIAGSDMIFRRGGVTLFTAESSEEILNLHRDKKANLIITEYALPLMGAVKLCSAIRGDAELENVSIVVVGDSRRAFEVMCREAGANACIAEPVDPIALFSKVSELLLVPQRKAMRVLLRVSVKGRGDDSSFLAASQNISISGMLLESDRELKKGDQMTCAFNIAHNEIRIQGTVVRAKKVSPGRYRYGVNFVNLDTKSLIIIEQYVKVQVSQ